MQEFSYHGFYRLRVIASKLTGVLAIFIFTGTVVLLMYGMNKMPTTGPEQNILENPKVTLLCLIIYLLAIAWIFGLFFINFFPTVWISEKGLIISGFLFFRFLVRWDDVVDIGAGQTPAGYFLVRARHITPFHRIYGWLYSRTFHPSFLIGKGISDRDILIGEIKRRIQKPT